MTYYFYYATIFGLVKEFF